MNGHMDSSDEDWRKVTKSSVMDDTAEPAMWKDIQQNFIDWSADLQEGELLSIPNFSLYDAMSAIELMDKKMDIGLLLKDRKIKSFEEGISSGLLKMTDFTPAEYLAVFDRSLANVILWMQGHCLAQTVFTLLYLHKPDELEDEFIKSFCWCLLTLTSHIRQIMLDGGVIEEEDFQVSSMQPCPSAETSPLPGVIVKSLKTSEELCNKNSRRYRASGKDNSFEDKDSDESQQWTALGLRFKFCRTLLQLFISFDHRSEQFFLETSQYLDILSGTVGKILNGYNVGEDAFSAAPGFEPLISLHLLPPSFPRHTPVTVGSGAFLFFQNLTRQFRLPLTVRDHFRTMEDLVHFLRTECSTVDSALIRSMIQIVIRLSLGLKCSASEDPGHWNLTSVDEFMGESLRVLSNPPVLMPGFAQYEKHGQMKDYIQTFLRSCSALSASLLRMNGLNKARQRDALAADLVDLFSIQDDAEKLDEYFNTQLAELKLVGLNHTFCFGSWTLTTMLNAMADYLFCGLELQLYANTELHFVYWYLYDVLLHCQVQTIIRAESAARENEMAWNQLQETDSKSSKRNSGKKRQNGKLNGKSMGAAHAVYLAYAQTLHHLCGAFHFALLALQWQDKVKMPEQSLDCEEFRYYHRLMPFMERNAPAFVDYQHYQTVKSVMARSHLTTASADQAESSSSTLDTIRDAYCKASYHFQQADRVLVSWPKPDEKTVLSKLCKRNDVIVRILATGRTYKSVELKFDLHHWFPSLSIL